MASVAIAQSPTKEDLGMCSKEEKFDHDEKKKKQKRRRRRHKMSDNETSNNMPTCQNPLQICFTPLASQEEETSKQEKKKKKSKGVRGPVLRPVGAQVPRAPNNSTQFIMDDHENSSLFIHFNRDEELYQQRKKEEDESGSSPYPPSDWLPYNAMDFQTTYQSAREDQMMNGTRENLRKAILGLEAKATIASSLLAASPSRLLAQLQSQLLKLQEDNKRLKSEMAKKKHHLEHCQMTSTSSSASSSSTSSGSESDSDSTQSSSSACSNPHCDTCALQRREQQDEEKENTCPGSEVSESSSG